MLLNHLREERGGKCDVNLDGSYAAFSLIASAADFSILLSIDYPIMQTMLIPW